MIKLENISKYYSSNDSVAMGLMRINLEFNMGEFVAITGESGSGKSTLLNVISGLDTYEEGEMYIEGEATRSFSKQDWENYRNQYISFVFQKYNIIDSFTVYQNIEAALIVRGLNIEERKSVILEIIRKVDLESKINQKASTLSGGEIQRTVIARALAKDSKIIVCDEPTGNLDRAAAYKIMELLNDISKERLVVVVTHNYDIVSNYCTRKIRLFDGEVAEDKHIEEPSKIKSHHSKYIKHSLKLNEYFKLTKYNLLAVPKKTLFMLFVFFFISFVFLLTLGARLNQESLDPFQGYGPFKEATNDRVIVTKRDYTGFTPSDLTQLSNLDNVEGIAKYDIVLDMRLLSAEFNEIHNVFDYNEYIINSVLSIDESELLEGRLPEKDNEILIGSLFDIELNSEIEMSFTRKYISGTEGEGTSISDTFIVVGKYKSIFPETIRSNAYFTTNKLNEIGQYLVSDYTDYNLYPTNLDFDKDEKTQMYIIINNDLALNEVIVSNDVYIENCFYYLDRSNCSSSDNSIYFQTTDFVLSGTSQYNRAEITIPVSVTYDSSSFGFQVSSATLDLVVDKEIYQPAVIIKDGFSSEEVMDSIEELGFKAFYPAGVEEEFSLIFITMTKLQFILNMLIVLIITYFIAYYVLRNIMVSKNKDYLVFRSFGTTKNTLNNIVKIEFSVLAIFGYLIAVSFMILNEFYGRIIPKYLRFYDWEDFIVLLAILIALVLLLVNRFNKKIFAKSVITSMNRE